MAKISAAVRGWYAKANDDLIGARVLWEAKLPRVRLLVGFHCQQAVEKVLKGFLLYNGKKIIEIHDIEYHAKQILVFAPELSDLLEQAAELTPYAVKFRYPSASEKDVIADEDVELALQVATKVVDEFTRRLPFEASLGDL